MISAVVFMAHRGLAAGLRFSLAGCLGAVGRFDLPCFLVGRRRLVALAAETRC